MKRNILAISVLILLLLASCTSTTTPPASTPIPPTPTPTLVPNDEKLIQAEFDRWAPGYSSIKVLERSGAGTGSNPRVLTIQATINSYPNPVVCEGELVFFQGDPSFLEMRWYTLEGIGHALLVQWASQRLKPPGGGASNDIVSLLLKRWVENGFISIDNIVNPIAYEVGCQK